ncbi:MAG: ATP-binding protein [Bacilli bacterium]|nr:ATP-binding protein [Bacilli bacterium]
MVILDLKLNNVLGFKDIHFNFTYPKKLRKNSLGEECLKGVPNFRYKKVNVVMGSNSNGKSSLGKTIWGLCLFFRKKESNNLIKLMSDGSDSMNISIDYVCASETQKYILNRVAIRVKKDENLTTGYSIKMDYDCVTLRGDDTYETACKNLVRKIYNLDYLDCLNAISHSDGWFIAMPITETGFDKFELELEKPNRELFSNILFKVLNTLDPNIQSSTVSNEIDDAYIIKFDDGKNTIVKSGDRITDIRYLSSGTKYGFIIATVIYSIGKQHNGLFYIDELFSYVDSDIEIAILNLMISLLGDCEQLFFSTHNSEVLLLPYPLHSFMFLGKEKVDDQIKIKTICASDVEKRNNVVVKNLYDNDYFDISPDSSRIFEIEELFDNGEQ